MEVWLAGGQRQALHVHEYSKSIHGELVVEPLYLDSPYQGNLCIRDAISGPKLYFKLCPQVKTGVANFLTKLVAPPAVIQAAIPDMIKNTPESFFIDAMEVFEKSASMCYSRLKDVPGLTPVLPDGAMYMMVRISRAPSSKSAVEPSLSGLSHTKETWCINDAISGLLCYYVHHLYKKETCGLLCPQ